MRDIRPGTRPKQRRRTTPHPDLERGDLAKAAARATRRPRHTPEPKRTRIYGRQQEATSPTRAQVEHAQKHGYDPGKPGPFATIEDKVRAEMEAQHHAPRTIGELGTRTSQLATGINPEHPLDQGPWWLGANILGSLPIFRGPRAAVKGLEAVRAGKGLKEAGKVALESRHAPGPIAKAAAKVARERRLRQIDKVTISSESKAKSRTGKAIERGADVIRPVAAKVTLGLVKSPTRKAAIEWRRQLDRQRKMRDALGHALAKSNLNKAQEYALLIVNEGVDPATRIEHHVHFGSTSPHPDTATYHALHASMNEAASKYITVGPDGIPHLSPDAPKKLHQAQDLFDRAAKLREHIYTHMNLLDEGQIAGRRDAPGRVFAGARYKTVEEEIAAALEANPGRKELFDHIDQMFAKNPAQANAQKRLVDATLRRYAEDVGDPVAGIDAALSHLYGVETNVPPPTVHPNDLPDDLGTLYQQGDLLAPDMPEKIRGPKEVQDLYKLVKQGAPYRDWYARAAGYIRLVAQQEGVPFDAMAQVVGITSQQAMPTLNLKRAVQAVQDFKQNGKITMKLLPGQAEKIERVLRGGQWSGRKTNSFYLNLTRGTDHVTVDRHIARQMFGTDAPTDKQYTAAEDVYRGIAAQLGWSPKEVQAAAWVPIKAESMRNAVLSRGKNAQAIEHYFSSAADAYERAYKRYIVGGLAQGEEFAAHAKQLLSDYEAFARDIAKTIPEEEWPTWMKNMIRDAVDPVQPIELPSPTSPLDEARGTTERFKAHEAIQSLRENGGFTLNPDFTPHEGGGFAVGVYPEAELQAPIDHMTHRELLAWRDRHADIFRADNEAKLGGWNDNGTAYLDVSKVVSDREEAMRLGREHNQKAIFDLDSMEEIPVNEALAQTGSNYRAGPGLPGWEPPVTDRDRILRNSMHQFYGDNKEVGAEVFGRDSAKEVVQAYRDTRFEGGIAPIERGLFSAMRKAREVGDANTEQRIWNHLKESGPPPVFQLSHEVGGEGFLGIKGAITFPDAQGALLHFAQHSDASTIVHEWAHFAHSFLLRENQMKVVNRALGAGADTAFQDLTRPQKEKFASWMESYVRNHTSPNSKVTRALESASAELRKIYDDADLPNVPKDVAKVIDSLYSYKTQAGGRLIGAEDVHVGLNRVPYHRGVPVAWSEPAKSLQGYINHLLHGRAEGAGLEERSLFSKPRGQGSAVGGPSDETLKRSYKGSGLFSGYFKIDVTKAMAKDLITASRLSAAHDARKGLIEIGNEIPATPYDVPVKVDPTKNVSPELRALQERMSVAEREGHAITPEDLDKLDFDIVEKARQDVFPSHFDGRDARSIAHEIITTKEPIDNIVWVSPDFLDASGIFDVPGSAKLMRSGFGKKGALGAVDGFNDIQRALILWLSPSYAPVNLAGNLFMNLTQQGVFLPVNLYRAATMSRDMERFHRVFIDGQMGHGLIGSLSLQGAGPLKTTTNILGHGMGVVVDLMPRRAAWLHEARRLGLKKPEDLMPLIERAHQGDEEAVKVVDHITARANDAIVDYERLSPLEKNVLGRIIFFYPWLKGATRWSLRFVAEHPVQAAAFAMMYEHAQEYSNQKLGERPFYAATDIPIGTGALGLKVPGTGIDLSAADAVGDKQWTTTRDIGGVPTKLPMKMNVRQIFTQTTPMELYESALQFATGNPNLPDFSQNLTPLPYSAAVALFGYDPFRHKEVPRGLKTFLNQSFGNIPIVDRLHQINMSAAERKAYQEKAINPRSKGEEIARTFGSGLAPAPYNPKIGVQRVQQTTGTTFSRHRDELIADSKHFEMGDVPDYVIEELERKVNLDHDIHKLRKSSYREKLAVAAPHYDKAFGGSDAAEWVKYAQSERKARYYYERIRERLYPHYLHWQHIVDSRSNREIEKSG